MVSASMGRPILTNYNGSLAQDLLIPWQSPEDSMDIPKKVVVVMDGLKEFSLEPVEWVLKNITLEAGCQITLICVTPWLNIPLSTKTWSDVWTMHLENIKGTRERSVCKSHDVKHQKVQQLVDLCQQYGVVPQMRSQSGFPMQLIAVEKIISLHATLVVFDRHHRKYKDYYAERIPCNMVVMNGDHGEVDMIKGKSSLFDDEENDTFGGSPKSSAPPTPLLIIAEHLKRILNHRSENSEAESSRVGLSKRIVGKLGENFEHSEGTNGINTQDTFGESPESSAPPTLLLIIAEHLKRILNHKSENSEAESSRSSRAGLSKRIVGKLGEIFEHSEGTNGINTR